MSIWFFIFIPIIAVGLLYWKFTKRVAWWEGSTLLVVSALLILGLKSCGEHSQTRDVERYQDYVVKVEHYHYWNEWISQTCSETCCCDKNGNNCTTTTYDCSYEEDYSPYTIVYTSTGKTFKYYEGYRPNGRGGEPIVFNRLTKKFATTSREYTNHRSMISTNYGKGFWGEVDVIKWKGQTERIEYATWEHTYENRVQVSSSIEKFPTVDTSDIKRYGLYEYPKIYNSYKSNAILGENNSLDEYVNQLNSLVGASKQLKVFYLIYKNQPMEAGFEQQNYWGGGNKNEVNICIGINDKREIEWAYVFSWSKVEIFKIEIRNNIVEAKHLSTKNFKSIINYSHKNIVNNYIRREFSEFDFLSVESPTWAYVTALIVILLITIGGSIFIVTNDHNIDGIDGSRNGRW